MASVSESQINQLSQRYNIPVANIKTVIEVESDGSPFRSDGMPTFLFEPHLFTKRTNSKYKTKYPQLYSESFTDNKKKGLYKSSTNKSLYDLAYKLEPNNTIMSTSWGVGQLLGEHYNELGYKTPKDFLESQKKSVDNQVSDMFKFIALSPSRLNALRNKDWDTFARLYNGSGYKENKYDQKLATAYEQFKEKVAETTEKVAEATKEGVETAKKHPVLTAVISGAIVLGIYFTYQYFKNRKK